MKKLGSGHQRYRMRFLCVIFLAAGFGCSGGTPTTAAPQTGTGGGGGATGITPVPTFTELYDQIFDDTPVQAGSSCWGSNCHAPVPDPGVAIVDFSTRAKAYGSLVPEFKDSLVDVLSEDLDYLRMPKDRPRLSGDLIARYVAWVNAGAPNN